MYVACKHISQFHNSCVFKNTLLLFMSQKLKTCNDLEWLLSDLIMTLNHTFLIKPLNSLYVVTRKSQNLYLCFKYDPFLKKNVLATIKSKFKWVNHYFMLHYTAQIVKSYLHKEHQMPHYKRFYELHAPDESNHGPTLNSTTTCPKTSLAE